jgi:hypothetical protein
MLGNSVFPFDIMRNCSSSAALFIGRKLASLMPTHFKMASKLPSVYAVTDFIIHMRCSFNQVWIEAPVERISSKCFRREDRKMNEKTINHDDETWFRRRNVF